MYPLKGKPMMTRRQYRPYVHRRPKCRRKPSKFSAVGMHMYACVYNGAHCAKGEPGWLEAACYAQPRKKYIHRDDLQTQ